jgi:hypothetical protein
MSLIVVCVIVALAAIWYFRADGVKSGDPRALVHGAGRPGDDGLHPAAGLVLLLPLLPPADLQVAGDGVHRHGRHPTIGLVLLMGSRSTTGAERRRHASPVAMVAAVLTCMSMAVLTWKGATAKEALGSELILLVPSWAEQQGFTGTRRPRSGAKLFAQSGCLNCHTYLGQGDGHPRRAEPLGDRRDERRRTSSSTSTNPAAFGNHVMGSYSYLGRTTSTRSVRSGASKGWQRRRPAGGENRCADLAAKI